MHTQVSRIHTYILYMHVYHIKEIVITHQYITPSSTSSGRGNRCCKRVQCRLECSGRDLGGGWGPLDDYDHILEASASAAHNLYTYKYKQIYISEYTLILRKRTVHTYIYIYIYDWYISSYQTIHTYKRVVISDLPIQDGNNSY